MYVVQPLCNMLVCGALLCVLSAWHDAGADNIHDC